MSAEMSKTQQRDLARRLFTLSDAFACALQHGIDAWQLAVGLNELTTSGIHQFELRWLIANGLIYHAHETTSAADHQRHFDSCGRFVFCAASCFVLTESGRTFASERSLAESSRHTNPDDPPGITPSSESDRIRPSELMPEDPSSTPDAADSVSPRPTWCNVNRELRVRDTLVKRFRVPAPNQEAILNAFEEEGWPTHIDDPLSQSTTVPAKSRLHSAINCLNRNQKQHLIQFSGNGNGDGIRWQLTETS